MNVTDFAARTLLAMAVTILTGISAPAQDGQPTLVLNSIGHTAYIRDVLFADDQTVISTSYDGTVREWDVTQGRLAHIYRGELGDQNFGEVHGAALTPDGRFLLTGGWFHPDENGTHPIRIYDRTTKQLVHVVQGHRGPVRALAVSPDGRFVATGDYHGLVYLWSLQPDGSLSQINGFQGHNERVTRIAFAQVGPPRLVSIGYDKLIRFWSYDGGQFQFLSTGELPGMDNVWWVAPHPSKPLFAIGGNMNPGSIKPTVVAPGTTGGSVPSPSLGRVGFFTADGQQLTDTIDLHEGVGTIAFSGDGLRLAIGTGYPASTSSAYIYSWPSMQRLQHYRKHERTIVAIAVSPDGRRVASIDAGNQQVHVWDANSAQPLTILGSLAKSIWSTAFSADGKKLLWGSHLHRPNEGVPDHELNTRGKLEWSFDLETLTLRSAAPAVGDQEAFNPNNINFGAQPTPSTEIESTEHDPFEGQRGMLQHGGRQLTITRDAQGRETVTALPGGRPFTTGRERDKINGMTFLPSEDGRGGLPIFVVGSHTCQIYDGLTGQPGIEFRGHRDQVNAVAPSPSHPYALTGGADKTLRLWNVRTGEHLLSLFVEGDDWVTWAPTGHYASSPRGERLIGWQINKGPNQLPDFFDGTQFHETLYRPDVIRAILGQGNVTAAITAGGGQQVTVQKVLPPVVELLSPTDLNVRPADGKLQISVQAQSRQEDNPLVSLTLYMNGRPFEGRNSRRRITTTGTDPVTETWDIDVPPGENAFTVRAATNSSHTDSPVVNVVYQVDVQTDRKLFVLSIGITEYADATIDRLYYAHSDAEQLSSTLAEYGRPVFREVVTRPLTNAQANKSAILDGLKWLRDEMTDNDIGVVLYSGHGAVDDSFGGFFFLPSDVDDEKIADRGISADLFKRALAEIPGRLVVMLDACHAGAVSAGGIMPSQELNEDMIHSLTNEQPGIDVICSTDGQSVSEESHELAHGYFSHVVLEGLKGQANDRRFDTIVTNLELESYINNSLTQLTGGRQVPQSGSSNVSKAIPLTQDRKEE
ncbi:MAG: caspase family protein [Planctomycetaceae bacterium]|nr:caspase family protein [Planctomycetaceae bacterium]